MYAEDSFFTLTTGGQIGLAILSACLGGITVLVVYWVTRKRPKWLRLTIAVLAYFAFIWLAPQFYYFYYVLILDVPMQLVIQRPPTPLTLLKILTFQETANLSYHAQGVIGWLLIAVSQIKR